MPEHATIAIGWTTTPERALAEKIGRALVEQRLVACAQITGPVTSIYRWKDQICQDEEYRLVVKFAAAREAEVYDTLARLHPYETPQWVVTHADAGSSEYITWVYDSTSGDMTES